MTPEELRKRTKAFALDIIRFCRTLPRTEESEVISRQLLRAGTSVGANYRAACRRRSDADFIAKLGLVIEESDESGFWLEILVAAELVDQRRVERLLGEADELTRIFVASRETAKRNARARSLKPRARNH
jgi:four helix bundle protein